MKKVLLALVLISLLAVPAVSLAQETIPEGVIDAPEDLIDLIDTIADWIFTALMAIAVIFLVVAGFMWVTAGGNVESTTKARQMLINALIGVAIGLGAKGLVAVIRTLIGA